jgi:carbamoyltransferase
VGIAFGDIGHDAAAVLVRDGQPVFAVEEERLNRKKHFMGLPVLAAEACIKAGGSSAADLRIAHYLDADADHLRRRVESCKPHVPASTIAAIEQEYAHVQQLLQAHRRKWPTLQPVDHHLAHAASAFYPSGFEKSLVLVIDGQGECASTSLYLADNEGLHPLVSLPITSSLGILYSDVTAFVGFEPIEDEYKIMGLAAYGNSDEYRKFFDETIVLQDDGHFTIPCLLLPALERIDLWMRSLGDYRFADQPIEPRHIAIAHSLQCALERTVIRLLEHYESKHKTRHLCLAGGVALNCSLNGVIDRSGMFDKIFVQPAANDPGAAFGAALLGYYQQHPDAPRARMKAPYLGPSYEDAAVRRALDSFAGKVTWTRPDDYVGEVATRIANGDVIGWFQGRMEFGPRALGNRSILADARRADMKDRVNQAVKKREEFRPFAPSVAQEGADQFFDLRSHDQYEHMTVAVRAKPERKAEIPSVVHVNGTARVQLVRREQNPRYWELLTRFGEQTKVPIVLNTSFNIKGEPIVCTPEDAIRCFLGTGIDRLAIEGYVVSKTTP